MYEVVYSKTVLKEIPKLKATHLDGKTKALIEILRLDPYQSPPSNEKLVGNLAGLYSRRINVQHRLVYKVCEEKHIVKIYSMWTHYEAL